MKPILNFVCCVYMWYRHVEEVSSFFGGVMRVCDLWLFSEIMVLGAGIAAVVLVLARVISCVLFFL